MTKINVFYIFHVSPQLQYKRMIEAKERGCYETLYSRDNTFLTNHYMNYDYHMFSKYLVFQMKTLVFQSKY